jgi:regulator of protease activity HflC (stomatin/prohibitin superfamily)
MGIIIFIIFLALVAIVGLGFGIFGLEASTQGTGAAVAGLGALAVFLTFLFGGMQSVPVKSIGVPQEFGTISGGVMSPGLHWTFQPWMTVTNVDETVQTTTFEGNNGLAVRIGGQQSATADATIQWQIEPPAASSLYQDYANQGDLMRTITDAVVVREFKQVVNEVLGDYNPITDVQNVSGSTTATSQFTQFGPEIQEIMQRDLAGRISVKSVFLPKITYDAAVESALQSIQTANANFAIATENVKTAVQQADQYQKLGNPTLNQLVAQCLVEAQKNPNLQCIPGATTNLMLSGSTSGK